MKKTFYLMMLAAAITGSQAFADFIPTTIEGDGEFFNWGTTYEYDGNGKDPDNGHGFSVTVKEDGSGKDRKQYDVYGAIVANGIKCTDNTVLMTGGEVKHIYGGSTYYSGDAASEVSGNKVVMTGGIADAITGGQNYSEGDGAILSNNEVVIAGGSVTGTVMAAYSDTGVVAADNTVRLIGKGAKYENYEGGHIELGGLQVSSVGSGATLEIAGSDIAVNGRITTKVMNESALQNLNFSLVDDLLTSSAPMLQNYSNFDLVLTGVNISVVGDAVTDWSKFDGKTLTLVHSSQDIVCDFELNPHDVAILDNGVQVATGTLQVHEVGEHAELRMTVKTTPVPEPATGTLSLLALAGLCARRRRK